MYTAGTLESMTGGETNWEILQIKSNPQAWDRIKWYEDGKIVSNPFE